jgi:hypothetical protein
MKRFLGLVAFLWWTVSIPLYGNPSKILATIQEKTSWKPAASAHVAISLDSDELPKHRSRDAHVFLEYGFSKLTHWRLSDSEARLVTLDLYEMIDPPAAYGIFTFLRNPSAESVNGIGNLAALSSTELSFEQDRYYIHLQPAGSIAASRQSLLELARIVSQSLPRKFSLPPVAELLPKENRVRHSEKFLMGSGVLTHLIPMDTKDPFGLATGAEAALAKYQSHSETATLLLIHYPTQQLARKFLEAGYAEYSAKYPNQPVFYKRDGPMVVLVFNSNSPELATTLLDKVSYVSMVSWDPKVEPPTIGEVMIRIFIFCGVMLGLTFACGFVFGLIRIVVKRFFPGKVFDRPKTMEVIRLNLGPKK